MKLPAIPFVYKLIGVGALTLALIALVWSHFASDARTRAALSELTAQAATVLSATKEAADNPDLKWAGTAGQIVALGASNRALKGEIVATNLRIDEMARQAVAAKAHAAEMVKIAEKAKAQRAAALRKLSDLAMTPGTRDDCLALLREAEDALDIAYDALNKGTGQ